ncbi:DUF423 domain-containing protein [Candidatus Binatia bacterium]|jgi:uncharacterized membrane protein YgdD (TMEM256/DUF423 family)|nr:DUF423 domain-containing protein [Candidatus Binatia bacterium]
MTPNGIVALGAVLAGLGVAVGAFGAHGLQGRVPPEMLTIFEVGVRYQMYHALALVLLGLFAGRGPSPAPIEVPPGVAPAAWLFVAGIALFSGSLYALVLTGTRWLGAITPLGGVSFLAGWAMFARAALLRS